MGTGLRISKEARMAGVQWSCLGFTLSIREASGEEEQENDMS